MLTHLLHFYFIVCKSATKKPSKGCNKSLELLCRLIYFLHAKVTVNFATIFLVLEVPRQSKVRIGRF